MSAPPSMQAPVQMSPCAMQGPPAGGMTWNQTQHPQQMVPPVSKDVSSQAFAFKGKGKQGCGFEGKCKGGFDGGNMGGEGMGGWESSKSSFSEGKGKGDGRRGKGGKDDSKGKREDGKGKGGKDRKGKKGRDFGPFDLPATVQKLMAIANMEREEAVKESIHIKHVLCGTEADKFISGLAPAAPERSLLQLALQPVLWRFPRSLRSELMETMQKNGIELTDEHEKGKGKDGKGGKGKDRDGKGKGKGKGKRDRGGRYRNDGGGDQGFRRRGRRDRRGGYEEEGERGRTGANTIEVNWKPPGGDGEDEDGSDGDDDDDESEEEEDHYAEDEEGGEHSTSAEGWHETEETYEGTTGDVQMSEAGWDAQTGGELDANEGQAMTGVDEHVMTPGEGAEGELVGTDEGNAHESVEKEVEVPGEADEDADEEEAENQENEGGGGGGDPENKTGDDGETGAAVATKEVKKVKVKKKEKKKKKSLSPVRGPVGRGRGNAMPAWMTAGLGAAATSKPEEPPGPPAGRGRGTATPAWMQKGVGQSALPPCIPPEVGEGGDAEDAKPDAKLDEPNILDSIFEERDLTSVNLEKRSRSPRRYRGRRKGGKRGKGEDESDDEEDKGYDKGEHGGKKGKDGKKGKGKGKGRKGGGDQEHGGWWNRDKESDEKDGGWWASKQGNGDQQDSGWWDSSWKKDSQQDGGWWDSGAAQQWSSEIPRGVGKAELKKLVQAAMNAMWNWQPGA